MKRTITIFLLVAVALSSYADMISVPGGTFTMGIYQGYGGHTVTVSTFWMDAAHITVGEYQVYCAATTNEMPDAPLWGWDNTNLPMCNVTWQEARDYAEWAGKRLPTEAESLLPMDGVRNHSFLS